MSETDLLYSVTDSITTGWELCGSLWGNSEAEVIACQAIGSCRLNHENHGDAFSWQGDGTTVVSGGGLADNPTGMASLVAFRCIVVEPYTGTLSAPDGTVKNEQGQPMVIRVTRRLLEYAAAMCDKRKAKIEATT